MMSAAGRRVLVAPIGRCRTLNCVISSRYRRDGLSSRCMFESSSALSTRLLRFGNHNNDGFGISGHHRAASRRGWRRIHCGRSRLARLHVRRRDRGGGIDQRSGCHCRLDRGSARVRSLDPPPVPQIGDGRIEWRQHWKKIACERRQIRNGNVGRPCGRAAVVIIASTLAPCSALNARRDNTATGLGLHLSASMNAKGTTTTSSRSQIVIGGRVFGSRPLGHTITQTVAGFDPEPFAHLARDDGLTFHRDARERRVFCSLWQSPPSGLLLHFVALR
jgi:hypothetical protein